MDKRTNKKAKVTVIVLTIALFIIVGLPLIFKDQIKDLILANISKYESIHIEYGETDLSLFKFFPSMSLSLKDLKISHGSDTILTCEEATLSARVLSLLREDAKVTLIELKRPTATVVIHKDSTSNIDFLYSLSSDGDSTGSFSLQSLLVSDGSVSVINEAAEVDVTLRSIDTKLKGRVSAKEGIVAAYVEVGSASVSHSKRKSREVFLETYLQLHIDFEEQKYTLKNNYIQVNEHYLSADGWFSVIDEGIQCKLDFLAKDTKIRDLFAIIPSYYSEFLNDIDINGDLNFYASVIGKITNDEIPVVLMDVDITDGYFKHVEMHKPIEGISFKGRLYHNHKSEFQNIIRIDDLSFGVLSSSFSTSGHLYDSESDLFFEIDNHLDLNLEDITDLYPSFPLDSLSGQFSINLASSGNYSDLTRANYGQLSINGKSSLRGIRHDTNLVPFSIEKGDITFSAQKISIDDLRLKLRSSDSYIQGSISNYIPYIFENAPLDIVLSQKSDHLNISELASMFKESGTQPTAGSGMSSTLANQGRINFKLTNDTRTLSYYGEDVSFKGNLYAQLHGSYKSSQAAEAIINGLFTNIKSNGAEITIRGVNQPIRNLTFDLTLDREKSLAVDLLKGNIGKSQFDLSGIVKNIYASSDETPIDLALTLNSNNIDLTELLTLYEKQDLMPSMKDTSPSRTVLANLTANVDKFSFHEFKADSIHTIFSYSPEVLNASKLTANVFDGKFKGQIMLKDLSSNTPMLHTSGKALHFELERLDEQIPLPEDEPWVVYLKNARGDFNSGFNYVTTFDSTFSPILEKSILEASILSNGFELNNVDFLDEAAKHLKPEEITLLTFGRVETAVHLHGLDFSLDTFRTSVNDYELDLWGSQETHGRLDYRGILYVMPSDLSSGTARLLKVVSSDKINLPIKIKYKGKWDKERLRIGLGAAIFKVAQASANKLTLGLGGKVAGLFSTKKEDPLAIDSINAPFTFHDIVIPRIEGYDGSL